MHPTHRLICAQVGAPRAALNDALGGRRVALGADIDAYRRIVSGDCTADEVEKLVGADDWPWNEIVPWQEGLSHH